MFGRGGDKPKGVSLGKDVESGKQLPDARAKTAESFDQPTDDLGPYPENVTDQPSHVRALERTLRVVGLVAMISGLINVAMIMLLIVLLPLQKVVPFLVTFKSQDNQVVKVEPFAAEPQTMRFATEDNVRQYVVERHKVTPNFAIMNEQWGAKSRIAAQTSVDTYNKFRASADNELKQLVSQNYSRDVEINSVAPLTGGTWQVVFTTIDHSAGGMIPAPTTGAFGQNVDTSQPGVINNSESRQQWVATMRVTYEPQQVKFSQRLLNPLGFTVTDYSVTRRS